MQAILITTDDEMSVISLDERVPLHKSLGKVIGCDWIEVVHPRRLEEPLCMIVDEESLLKEGQKLNGVGSVLYCTDIHSHPILGNIVIMKEGFNNGEPDIVGLSEHELNFIYEQLKTKFNLKEISK